MIRIHIGNNRTFPEDVMKVLLKKFNSNAANNIFPKVFFVDNHNKTKHEVSKITKFGITEDDFPAIDINLKINLELDESTGEIISATIMNDETEEKHKALERG